MPIDPSISLGVTQPNFAQTAGSYIDLARKSTDLRSAKANATVNEANVQPLIEQQKANTRTSQAQADAQELATMRSYVTNARQQLQPLYNNPNATVEDLQNAIFTTLKNSGAPSSAYGQAFSGLPKKGASPQEINKYVTDSLLQSQDVATQLDKIAPAPAMINNGAQTMPVAAGNQQLTGIPAGTPQGVATPNQIGPAAQEEVQSDAQGNRYIVQRSPQGAILSTRPVPGSTSGAPAPEGAPQPAGPVNLPPNETPQTRDQLQGERNAAQQAILQAPQMHNINQEIAKIADTDVQTGKLGMIVNKISSATGYNLGKDEAADYNTLGKMLARSNATLAASMPGPHTNAGLEQTNAANGSPEYDKVTLKKIANLNDALVTGTELYQKGLENAIKQNGIFGKRQFDQAWAQSMDIDALRLKNAVDNGNSGEINMILKTVGGKGSPGAKKLLEKLGKIDALAGQ